MEEAALWSGILVGITALGGILGMVSIARQPKRCPKCEHCDSEIKKAQEKKDIKWRQEWRMNHDRGHRWDFGDLSGICPHCKESGRVPPPSRSQKKDKD